MNCRYVRCKASSDTSAVVLLATTFSGAQQSARLLSRLLREARMQPAGLREVQKAKADGRWNAAYQSRRKAEPPSDFLAALALAAKAERAFARLDRANRYAFVYRVNDATRLETREKRIHEFVEMLARGETIHPTKGQAGSNGG